MSRIEFPRVPEAGLVMQPLAKLRELRDRTIAMGKRFLEDVEVRGGTMTGEESRTFDTAMADIERLKKAIDHKEGIENHKREIAAMSQSRTGLIDISPDGRRTRSKPMYYDPATGNLIHMDGPVSRLDNAPLVVIDERTGREIRGLRYGESISTPEDASGLPDGIKPSELSLGRLIKARVTGDWRGAEAERRAMGESSDVLGGFVVSPALSSEIIDLARNKSVVLAAGAVTMPMDTSELKLAKVRKDPTASWKVENQPGALSEMNFGQLKLDAKTLMALFSVSVELIEDAANLDGVVRNSLAQVLALALDLAALRGDGAGASPVGILNTSGVQSIAAVGKPTDFSKFSEAVEDIQTVNGEPNAVIYAPKLAGLLDRLQDTTHQPLQPPASFAGLQKLVSNQVPVNLGGGGNESEAYVGDFSEAVIGMRKQLVVEVSRVAGGDNATSGAFRNLQVWIRGYLRADCVLLKPEHFVVLQGITF